MGKRKFYKIGASSLSEPPYCIGFFIYSGNDLPSRDVLGSLAPTRTPSLKSGARTWRKMASEFLLDCAGGEKSPKIRSTPVWQQKRVSIKTLEGEFSVTLWASGTEDGE